MPHYVYPAIFHLNEDESYTVIFPDLEGCITEGKNLEEAMGMAQDALAQWLEYLKDKKEIIPAASDIKNLQVEAAEFSTLIRADIRDTRAVKRTVSIPKWLDEQVAEAGLSLSRVLQDALKQKLRAAN